MTRFRKLAALAALVVTLMVGLMLGIYLLSAFQNFAAFLLIFGIEVLVACAVAQAVKYAMDRWVTPLAAWLWREAKIVVRDILTFPVAVAR